MTWVNPESWIHYGSTSAKLWSAGLAAATALTLVLALVALVRGAVLRRPCGGGWPSVLLFSAAAALASGLPVFLVDGAGHFRDSRPVGEALFVFAAMIALAAAALLLRGVLFGKPTETSRASVNVALPLGFVTLALGLAVANWPLPL